ncbi:MAG: potassium-transporting ATPase subunit KdpC [Prolixibacteraceae bacterium]|jgi:K+-transporting ATPase ATPase C chain|nr:potassium-transporting ATPase subunit KdpC [Prolixibacteraceae bacterium]
MKSLFISLKIFLFFTVVTGVIYPLFVTGIAQIAMPAKANGSLILKNNKIIGSELIGQRFDSVIYFSSRPSAISYNPLPSGGSNFGLTNTKLKNSVDTLKKQFIVFNQLDSNTTIPSEMVFASASGLDPHISQKAALFQVDRIARARNLSPDNKQRIIQCVKTITEAPQFLLLGEERVNVLVLNLELDKIDVNATKN